MFKQNKQEQERNRRDQLIQSRKAAPGQMAVASRWYRQGKKRNKKKISYTFIQEAAMTAERIPHTNHRWDYLYALLLLLIITLLPFPIGLVFLLAHLFLCLLVPPVKSSRFVPRLEKGWVLASEEFFIHMVAWPLRLIVYYRWQGQPIWRILLLWLGMLALAIGGWFFIQLILAQLPGGA